MEFFQPRLHNFRDMKLWRFENFNGNVLSISNANTQEIYIHHITVKFISHSSEIKSMGFIIIVANISV